MTPEGREPFVTPRALDLNEIGGVIDDFRHAAEQALAAEFDGVELHGANGYLIDQFLRDKTNRRTDRYGGTIANRSRLLLETVDAIVDVWGAARVGVRLSPSSSYNDMGDSDPASTFGYVVEALDRFDLAYIHLVEIGVPAGATGGPRLEAAHFRPLYHGRLIANGGYDCARAEAVLDAGAADLISFGVPFLANPDLPARLIAGGPFNTPDRATFYGGGDRGYADYPTLGGEGAVAAGRLHAAE